MTTEDKELLFKDLCARIPYRVKVQTGEIPYKTLDGMTLPDYFVEIRSFQFSSIDWLGVKPYLFPLSSMTEEQKIELTCIIDSDYAKFDWYNKNHFDYRGLIPMGLAIDATNLNIY